MYPLEPVINTLNAAPLFWPPTVVETHILYEETMIAKAAPNLEIDPFTASSTRSLRVRRGPPGTEGTPYCAFCCL